MLSSSGILYALYPTTVMKAPLLAYPLWSTSQVIGWRRFSRCRSSSGGSQFAEDKSPQAGTQGSGLQWIDDQEGFLQYRAEREGQEEIQIEKIGLQPRSLVSDDDEPLADENDQSRYFWHRLLHECAERGDFLGAEQVVDQMRHQRLAPGPKAYHALIYSYVRGRNSQGALKAIRKAVNMKKGVQPLPQSYAAVIQSFLLDGDVETAEAVYASNRRSGVSAAKSWTVITTALFNADMQERALQLVEQGEQEGLLPNRLQYEAMINCFCRHSNVPQALRCLREMQNRNLQPTKQLIGVVLGVLADVGNIEEAESLLFELLTAPGTIAAASCHALNAVLQMYVGNNLQSDELRARLNRLREVVITSGMDFDRVGYINLLKIAASTHDSELAMQALQYLQGIEHGSLEEVPTDTFVQVLCDLSSRKDPLPILEVLNIMSSLGRSFEEVTVPQDIEGRTFVTAWFDEDDNGQEDGRVAEEDDQLLNFHGTALDPSSLRAVDDDGKSLPLSRMTMRQMRAELALRRIPAQGNKKDLTKLLTKARIEDSTPSPDNNEREQLKKINKKAYEETWSLGDVTDRSVFEGSQRDLIEEDESEGVDFEVFEEENDEEIVQEDEDNDEDLDVDDEIFNSLNNELVDEDVSVLRGGQTTELEDALSIASQVIRLGGYLSSRDLSVISVAAEATGNEGLISRLHGLKLQCTRTLEESV